MSNLELNPTLQSRKYAIFEAFYTKKPAKDETTPTGLKTSITNAKIKKIKFQKKFFGKAAQISLASKAGGLPPPCGPNRRRKEAQRPQEAKAGALSNTIGAQRAEYQEKRPKAATGAQEESTGHRSTGADRKSSRRGPLCFIPYYRAKKAAGPYNII